MIGYESNSFTRKSDAPPVKPPPPGRNVWLWLLASAMWTVVGLALFALTTALLTFGPPVISRTRRTFFGGVTRSNELAVTPAPIVALIVLTAVAAFLTARRRSHARRVVSYVHQAVRLNLPIPDLLHAAELGERGRMRARLRDLRRRLLDGMPLGRALELAAPGVPRRDVAIIEAGEHLGRLPEALDRVARSAGGGAEADDVPPDATGRLHLRWYPVVMLVFVGGAVNLFLYYVLPKFEAIFRDFDLPIPAATRHLIRFWSGPGGFFLTLFPVALLVWYCARLAAQSIAPRWAAAGPGLHLADRLAWGLPVLRGVVRGRGLADVFHTAGDALAAGATLDRALAEASTVPANAVVRGRVRRWADAVAGGAPVADAARTVGIPEFACGMLASGVLSAQLPEVVRFLARYCDARASRLAAAIEGAAIPAISLAFGFVVGAIALAVFTPLFRLIDELSKTGFQ